MNSNEKGRLIESMKQQVWTEDYKIASYLVNLRGRAGLYAILNFIQDVGWMHAIHLKVNLEKNKGWVFTRQKLLMHEWPAWNQTIQIRTWLRPPQGSFLLRDYEILLDDKKIGECTSTFTVMDLEARKLANVDWTKFESVWKQSGLLEHKPEKISLNSELQELAKFEVRNSDIDLNNHVNNTKYAQWILDAIPIEILRGGEHLASYEVNFLAETKSGDVVVVQKAVNDIEDGDMSIVKFQGMRVADSKPVFTAQMRVKR